jgi:hypothetical protein
VEPTLLCSACGVESEFPGLLSARKGNGDGKESLASGFDCVNHKCSRPRYWGEVTPFAFMARMRNSMSILILDQLVT